MPEQKTPRLRTVDKVEPPYPLNEFPKEFGYALGKEIIYVLATRSKPVLEGREWEEIFAKCVNATWKPSNVGLDDIILENCAWEAKTVKAKNPSQIKTIRLISGRNSPFYSFGVTIVAGADPNNSGERILSIWNERVSAIRKIYKHLRTVVLIKSDNLEEVAVYEFDTIRYDPELYYWEWNKNKNLVGFEKVSKKHRFTWQPHGSQFTIVEDVPEDCLIVKVKPPKNLDRETVLKVIGFDKSWVIVTKRNGR